MLATLKSVQVCRGLAAIAVLLFHAGGAFASPKYFGSPLYGAAFSFGSLGVEFFFVLSGYLIFSTNRSRFNRPSFLSTYILRRATRIYPLYWLTFIASVVTTSIAADESLTTLIGTFFLIPQTINTNGIPAAGPVGVSWTLQFEMFFYLLFGLFIINSKAGLLSFAIISILATRYGIFGTDGQTQHFITSPYLLLFISGMATAEIPINRPFIFRNSAWMLLFGSLLFLALGLSLCLEVNWLSMHRIPICALATSLILAAITSIESRKSAQVLSLQSSLQPTEPAPTESKTLCNGKAPNYVGRQSEGFKVIARISHSATRSVTAFLNAPLVELGNSSYSLYLFHVPIVTALCKIGVLADVKSRGSTILFIWFLLTVVIAILLSHIIHALVELPALNLLKSATPKPRDH